MSTSAVLAYTAAYFSLIVAIGVFLRDRQALVHRVFALGMLLFAVEEVLRGISYGAGLPEDVLYWAKRILVVSAIVPTIWLIFSQTYARVDASKFLLKWKWVFVAVAAVPLVMIGFFRGSLVTGGYLS